MDSFLYAAWFGAKGGCVWTVVRFGKSPSAALSGKAKRIISALIGSVRFLQVEPR